VERFRVEYWGEGAWQPWTSGTTIGRKRILLAPAIQSDRFRVTVGQAADPPRLQPMRLFRLPDDLHQELRKTP
jgi:hypothetical protein